jgi:hypothetical protein
VSCCGAIVEFEKVQRHVQVGAVALSGGAGGGGRGGGRGGGGGGGGRPPPPETRGVKLNERARACGEVGAPLTSTQLLKSTPDATTTS